MDDIRDGEMQRGDLAVSHYFQVIGRRRWLILPMFVCAIGGAALFSSLQKSVYSAETEIVVGQGNTLFQPQNSNAIQPLTLTMADLMMSNIVARDVISTLDLSMTPSALLSNISVSSNPQTAVLHLTADAQSPQQARSIASEFAAVFVRLVQQRFGQGGIGSRGAQIQSPITALVFDPAHVVPGKVSPKLARNLAVAAALGIVLSLAAAFLAEQLDGTLRSQNEIEAALGIPLIGRLPVQHLEHLTDPASLWYVQGGIGEAYRTLGAILSSRATESFPRTLVVASATEGQGKEAVTANLAAAIASAGSRTLVIEGDFRQRRLDAALDARPPGLTSVLAGDVPLGGAARRIFLRCGAVAVQLDFVPSGANGPVVAELLSGKSVEELLKAASEHHDCVLIDAAPLLAFADALHLVASVDGVLLVIAENHLQAREATELRSLFERLGARPIGVVVTHARKPRRRGQRPSGQFSDSAVPASDPQAAEDVAAADATVS